MSLTTSAACCNPTTPFKSVSFRRHPLLVVNAIEALQTTFEGQIEVPRVQGTPHSVRRNSHFLLPPPAPTSSFLAHNLCSDVTRPPTRKMRSFFLDRAAELKRRFQSHHTMQLHNDTSLQSWVGGRSFQMNARKRLCSKMAKDTKFCARDTTTLPPSKTLKLVILTPLRSVPHHNLCSDVTRPPTRKMRSFFLDRAAELKRRIPSHLITQQSIRQLSGTGHF